MKHLMTVAIAAGCIAIVGTTLLAKSDAEKSVKKPAATEAPEDAFVEKASSGLAKTAPLPLKTLQNNSKLGGLSSDADVQMLLDPTRTNLMVWLPRAPTEIQEAARRAARKLISGVSACLASATRCGADSSAWPAYFSTGSAPIMEPLEQALQTASVFSELGTALQLDMQSLAAAQKVPHHNISVLASQLRVERVKSRSDLEQAIADVPSTSEKARALYIKILASKAEEFGSANLKAELLKQILQSVQSPNPVTEDEVLQRIDEYKLNEEEMRTVVQAACAADRNSTRRQLFLDRKVAEAGFAIDIKSECQ